MKKSCITCLALLPIIWTVWTTICLAISYTIALTLGHIKPLVPFISELGIQQPEMTFTKTTSTISCIIEVAVMYLNFKFIKLYKPEISRRRNIFMLCCGLLSCVGFALAAYIRGEESTVGHRLGGGLGFGMGGFYNLLQCIVYIKSSAQQKNPWMVYYRMFVCVLTAIPFITFPTIYLTCEVLQSCNELYMTNAICTLEWIGMFGLLCYMPTYAMELKNMTLKRPKNMKDDWICKREVSTFDDEAPEEPTPVICVHKITLLPSNQIIGLSDPVNIQGTYQLTVLK
ncbi:hypothetical protein XELAEV_18044008mg [Xenopus laevis]|uniref:CWH43-like N-terminal domain-containing protein n=1 Tax=Xenopus laevis TaxID=8355 RepID=A0A974H3F3_XENLA|nr:hypothetical protein XELAEV_18044008mg [Xenopus laevis]